MILIADSGATKTDWFIGTAADQGRTVQTEGINPFHQDGESIGRILHGSLLPQLTDSEVKACAEVHFYGAGCLPSTTAPLEACLQAAFPGADIAVRSDLLGAARAVCGTSPGIACILGTGSNSCLYDGTDIVRNVSPLGYILGDEGSGACIGKRFVGDCLKGLLPADLRDGWLEAYGLTPAGVLDKVYRQPLANRFLASLAPYIHRHRHRPEVAALLDDCFQSFFRRNVLAYGSPQPVSFTGSVAWYFQEEVKKAAVALNLSIGSFVLRPIEGLLTYHYQQQS